MIAEYFKNQLLIVQPLIPEIIARAEFKTVWSGKRVQSGDILLQAYVYQTNTDDLKLITFVDRELSELDSRFNFVRMDERDIMPILAFKEDTKNRLNGN